MSLLSPGTELKRFRQGKLPKIALVVLLVIPLIYGALYLWAFWAPTDNMNKLPVAIVNLDDPAQRDDGTTLAAGQDVVDELLDGGDLAWKTMTADEAAQGVSDGDVYFSVTIPKQFSKTLAGLQDDPQAGKIEVTYNDSNSFLASTLGKQAMVQLRDAVAETTTRTAANELLVGVEKLSDGTRDAADAAGDLDDGAVQLSDGATALNTGLGELADGTSQLVAKTPELIAGTSQLADGLGQLHAGAGTLADGTGKVADGSSQLAAGAGKLMSGAQLIETKLGDLAAGAGLLNTKLGELATGAQALSDGANGLSAGATKLADGTAALNTSSQALASGADALATGTAQLSGGVGSIAQAAAANPNMTLAQLDAMLQQHGSSLQALAAGASGAADGAAQLRDGSAQLAAGATTLDSSTQQLAAGATTLAEKSGDLAGGASQIHAKSGDLASGAAQLHDGAGTLSTNLGVMTGKASELSAGAAQVSTGAATLSDKSGEAAAGGSKLAAGAGELASGASQLNDGAQQAHEGATKLSDGATKLTDGTGEFSDKLSDGAAEAPTFTQTKIDRMSDTIAAPIALDEQVENEVQGFGGGFAPFFMALASFVGALITWLILRALPRRSLATNATGLRSVLTGFWPAALIGLGQTIIMMLVLIYGIGLEPYSWLGTSLFLLLTTYAFLALQQMFIVVFGTATGRVISLVLLMLQLSSSGGTYPVETTPKFFQILHPFMPASYVVDGLRQMIGGGIDSRFWIALAVMLGILIVSVIVSAVNARAQKVWTITRLHPELAI